MPPALIPNDDQSQNHQISFQSPLPGPVPQNWGTEQDAYLAHHWQTLTTSKALNAFKQTIFTLNPRQPKHQCHPLSYDIDFLHDRLSHLLGPCLTEESSFPNPKAIHRYFHSHWHRIERNDWRFVCLNCRNDPSTIFTHLSTRRLRCGHCGCETIYHFELMGNEFLARYGSIQLGHQLRRKAILGLNLQSPEPKNFGQFWGVRKFQAA